MTHILPMLLAFLRDESAEVRPRSRRLPFAFAWAFRRGCVQHDILLYTDPQASVAAMVSWSASIALTFGRCHLVVVTHVILGFRRSWMLDTRCCEWPALCRLSTFIFLVQVRLHILLQLDGLAEWMPAMAEQVS